MFNLDTRNIKIFADGANLEGIAEMYSKPFISGFTTNPTLMKKAQISDYKEFSLQVLNIIKDKPVSFEVFSDEFDEMYSQAIEINSWANNVFVKIPITNTLGESAVNLIEKLSYQYVKVNVTAITTIEQVESVSKVINPNTSANVSIFAGRIADTGRDPIPYIQKAISLVSHLPLTEIIWASPRELLNIVQADNIGCHIITVTNDLLAKLPLIGKDLSEYSLETVKMFRNDALISGYTI